MGRAALLAAPLLALIGLATFAGGLRASGRLPPAASPSVPAPPAAALPGLRAGDLVTALAAWGLACGRPAAAPDGVRYDCRGRKPGVDYLVSYSGGGSDCLNVVEATVLQYGDPRESAAAAFLGAVAEAALQDGPAAPRAREWVWARMADDVPDDGTAEATTTIGGVRLGLSGSEQTRTLVLRAAP